MPICTHIKLDGNVCTRSHGPKFDFCAAHRPRAAVRKVQACAKCGKPTRRPCGLCLAQGCGLSDYLRDLRIRKKAEAAQRTRDAEEKAQQGLDGLAMDDYVASLIEELDISTPLPPPPPPSWGTLSDSARAELTLWLRKVFEADQQDGSGLHEPPAAPISSH